MNKEELEEYFARILRENRVEVTIREIKEISNAYNWPAIEAYITLDIDDYSNKGFSAFERFRLRAEREEYHKKRLMNIVESIAVGAARRSRMRHDSDDFVVYSHVQAITEGMKSISCDLGYPCRK
jgi:hypothetical protein